MIGKLTSGMITGFAGGLVKIADPTSNPKQLVDGALNVGLSIFGGSKVILKGSQALGLAGGTAEGLKALLQKGGAMADRLVLAREIDEYKKLIDIARKFNPELKDLIAKMEQELAYKQMVEKYLVTIGDTLDKKILDLLNGGMEKFLINIEKGKTDFMELLYKEYEYTFKGLWEALKKIFGENFIEYFNNLAGAKVDELFTRYMAELAGEIQLPFIGFKEEVDGIYEGISIAGACSFAIDVEVQDGTVTGEGVGTGPAFTCQVTLSGEADDDGNMGGTAKATYSVRGKGVNIDWYLGGTFSREVDSGGEGNLTIDLKGTGNNCPAKTPCTNNPDTIILELEKV